MPQAAGPVRLDARLDALWEEPELGRVLVAAAAQSEAVQASCESSLDLQLSRIAVSPSRKKRRA